MCQKNRYPVGQSLIKSIDFDVSFNSAVESALNAKKIFS
jgi:hypothetical protein